MVHEKSHGKTKRELKKSIRPTKLGAGILYVFAIGLGGVKATLPAHGTEQLDHTNKRLMNAFFNWNSFSVATGSILQKTIIVWVEDNVGWKWSFTNATINLSLTLHFFLSFFLLHNRKTPIPKEMIMKNGICGKHYYKFRQTFYLYVFETF
ncbi:hypothetical protein NE237_008525 [Protea cynaroides]|uniref:Uncharacterized protein n=1 Tax=Protea cynaroides TaxID=273540 RepID=A0A9Q0QZV2_9MAGN|nr:hypothetical protein NE237_008525 [Protea cynaroides]